MDSAPSEGQNSPLNNGEDRALSSGFAGGEGWMGSEAKASRHSSPSIPDIPVLMAAMVGLIGNSEQPSTQLESNVAVLASAQKSIHDEEISTDKKWPGWPGDNVFRLIVPLHKVGGIIGRKGEFVKKMCEETKSRIKILDGVPGTTERIVLVSAKEDPEAPISAAMDGILKVHYRVIEGIESDGNAGSAASNGSVSTRLLVAGTQAGSLIGRQGSTIKSIQDTSGATVRVLPLDELPLCALQDDRVVEIQGEAKNVHKAMELIVAHLRKFLVDRSVLPLFEYNRSMAPPAQGQPNIGNVQWGSSNTALSSSGGNMSTSSQFGSSGLPPDNYYQASDVRSDANLHHGLSLYGRDPSGGVMQSSLAPLPPAPVITQVTQHMQVPLSYADAIIGTGGANISYMRRTSGATITIQETPNVPGEMTVEIHGSAQQVQSAQQLIQNFMAGASNVSSSSYSSMDSSYNSYNAQNSLYPPLPVASSSYPCAPYPSGSYGTHYGSSYNY